VARNKLHTFLKRQQRLRRRTEDVAVECLPEGAAVAGPDEAALWEQEYQQRLFDWAAEQVQLMQVE
ncbi:MAG TPA: hypothetical protein VKD72_14775, partial [Gemmataceae bacterium]|nr:hypothetical protein [Gemmataceae bacterium]